MVTNVYFRNPDQVWVLYHRAITSSEALSMGRVLADLDYEVRFEEIESTNDKESLNEY